MSTLKKLRKSRQEDFEITRNELTTLTARVDSIIPTSLEPVSLGVIPSCPSDIIPITATQGYIPVCNFSNKQECQLVSLYSQGIDYKVIPEFITGPLDNGTISVIDVILYSDSSLDINNPANMMSVGQYNNKSFFGTFKILNTEAPGLILVGSYDNVVNSDSIFYQINGTNSVIKGSIDNINTLDPEKEYNFELMTINHIRRIYLKESTEDNWSYSFEDIIEDYSSHPVSSFGFLVNPNVVIRNLRCDSAFYNKRLSFSNLSPYINPIVENSLDKISIAFETNDDAEIIELIQIPNSGLWSDASNDLWVTMTYDSHGLKNSYHIDIFTENIYENVNNSSNYKIIGLLNNAEIPSLILNSLPDIKDSTEDPVEKDIIESIIFGTFFEDIIYLEQVPKEDSEGNDNNNIIIVWLINKSSLRLVRLLYTFTSGYTFDFNSLLKFGEPSQIKYNGTTEDTIEKNQRSFTYSRNSLKTIGVVDDILQFSDFYT